MWPCLGSAVLLMVTCSVSVSGQGNTKAECLSSKDCPSDRMCANWKCEDACAENICGDTNDCKVTNHIPVCTCKAGYSGPLSSGASSEHGKKMFYLHSKDRMNWHAANYYCLSRGMRLATLDSQDEHDQVVSMIKAIGPTTPRVRWWIGLTDLQRRGEFKWFSTGKPLTYRNFPNGQPDNAIWNDGWDEHCVGLLPDWDYRWNDFMCEQSQYFICEYFQ